MRKKADIKRILLIGIPMLLLAIGVKMLDNEAKILWFEKNGTEFTSARFYLFSGEKERAFRVKEDDEVTVQWIPELKKGSLELSVMKPSSDEALIASEENTFSFVTQEKGQVQLTIVGNEARGNFEVRWSTE